jgi:hypothetical protein
MLDPNVLHAAAVFAVRVALVGGAVILVALGAMMLRADRGRLARRACSDAR